MWSALCLISIFIEVLTVVRSWNICGPQNCDFSPFQLWNVHITKNVPSQNLPSVILYFVIHLAFFLESDKEKRDRNGFSLWGSMIQHYVVPSWVLALLVISLLPLSEVQVAELGTGRVILVQVLPYWWILLYSALSLWLQERSNQDLMLAAGKYWVWVFYPRVKELWKQPVKWLRELSNSSRSPLLCHVWTDQYYFQ